ncbi:hypothetical protein [Streptomyces sp. NPDC026673]|uniref:hypothetical protein n=1 Tax=Streptomyces sp. NPDC026673 TaxID=3155724 RepID=UPI0033D17751
MMPLNQQDHEGTMRIRTATIAVLLLAAPITACGTSEPSEAACKAALVQLLKDHDLEGKNGEWPAECEGLDDDTTAHLGVEAVSEWEKIQSNATDDAATTP